MEQSCDNLSDLSVTNLSINPSQKLQTLSWENVNVTIDENKKNWFRKANNKNKSIIKNGNIFFFFLDRKKIKHLTSSKWYC
jgi:hypothetical protein